MVDEKNIVVSDPKRCAAGDFVFLSGASIYDSSCSPEARVYFIDKGNGYYLKCSDSGELEKEAEMAEYFYSKGLGERY